MRVASPKDISKNNITKTQMLNQIHNRHQHNTDDGGQAMGEELRHVQMSRWSMCIGERSEQQQGLRRDRAMH